MIESELKEESKVFKTKSRKKRVYEFLQNKPDANIYELYYEFPRYKKNTLKYYKTCFRKEYITNHIINNITKEIIEPVKILLNILRYKMTPTNQLNVEEKDALQKIQDILKKYERY